MRHKDATQRFTNRVTNYIRSRPGYPGAVYDHLQTRCGLHPESIILDVGSGTGLLSQLFLKQGHTVIGVEPNKDMRQAGDRLLQDYPQFTGLDGRAENLPVADQSANLLIAGQAFHWFEPEAYKQETKRVSHHGAETALIWNEWLPELSPFLEGYYNLLMEKGTDFHRVSRQHEGKQRNIDIYFGNSAYELVHFPNLQTFDYAGAEGRLLSSSYVPLKGEPGFQDLLDSFRELFEEHQRNGKLQFDYRCSVYLGKIN